MKPEQQGVCAGDQDPLRVQWKHDFGEIVALFLLAKAKRNSAFGTVCVMPNAHYHLPEGWQDDILNYN